MWLGLSFFFYSCVEYVLFMIHGLENAETLICSFMALGVMGKRFASEIYGKKERKYFSLVL